MTNYEGAIQTALDEIESGIKSNVSVDALASDLGYSKCHFCRVFKSETGMTVNAYIMARKLEHALYELARGGRVLDAALDYGFETHAGFTKAFKRLYGCPPSLHRLRVTALRPERPTLDKIRKTGGGNNMQVELREMKPFDIVGYATRHSMTGVNGISDIPAFWDKNGCDCTAALITLHHTYEKSRHSEVCMCLDVDERHDMFTYMVGVGVDEADANVKQPIGAYRHTVAGGLYAVITTPKVKDSEYIESVNGAWKEALTEWLPKSGYEYDSARLDYEYYDLRDHEWENDGYRQMEIVIPVIKRGK